MPQLKAAVSDRTRKLTAEDLAPLIKAGLREAAVEQAVQLYCTAGNWDRANYIAQQLILPLITHLKREHIERIIRSPGDEHSDLLGSHGFPQILHAIVTEKVIDADDLKGMLKAYNLERYLTETHDWGDLPITTYDDIPF